MKKEQKLRRKKQIGLTALLLTLAFSANVYGAENNGWFKENNRTYYAYSSGKLATGMTKIDGLTYYMAADGTLQTGWIWHENNWYFAMPSGELTSGWLTLDGKWYYMRPNGVMVTKGWRTIDGVQYYMDEKGAVAVNQFIGKSYVNKSGVLDSKYEIKAQPPKKGTIIKKPTNAQYEALGEQLNRLPKVILNHFLDNGWTFVCVTDVNDYGTKTLFDDTYSVNVSMDGSRKEVKVAGTENVLLDMIDYYEKLHSISSKYSERLIQTMNLAMEEDMELQSNPGLAKETVRQYWIYNTMQYLETDSKEAMKSENPSLYMLTEEIAKAYQLN